MSRHLELLNLLNRGGDFNFRSREIVSEPGAPLLRPSVRRKSIVIRVNDKYPTGYWLRVLYILIRAFRAKKVRGMQIKHVRYSRVISY